LAIDYRVLPINLINTYLWDLIKGDVDGAEALPENVWDVSGYTNTPFFPIHENQGADTGGTNPFVLYDYLFEETKGTMYELKCERAIYTIVASSPSQLYAIKNFIQDTLNKFDSTAQSVNRHIQNDSIRFKFVKCSQDLFVMQELKQTERSFAPKFASTLSISYDYTRS
jgi:hypothetical protein